MTTPLPHLPDIERLSPRVIRILGGNPGKFSLQGTNTYLIGQGPQRLLIDTGEGKPVWAESLKKTLSDQNASISEVILTHWHLDHVGGVKDVLAISPNARIHKNEADATQVNVTNGQTFKTEGATLKTFHCPGHTTDHMALILGEEDAMFTGDNVLGHGTAVFDDLAAYMDSLDRMQHQFSGRAYPAHGAVIDDGKAKIKEYISHRQEREQQILTLLKEQAPDGAEGWQSMGIVKVIYKDYPEHLHAPAQGSVLHVLKKLENDGRVKERSGELWALSEKAAL